MATISMQLTRDEVLQALRAYIEGRGLKPSGDFSFIIESIEGDRPWESPIMEVRVFGVELP